MGRSASAPNGSDAFELLAARALGLPTIPEGHIRAWRPQLKGDYFKVTTEHKGDRLSSTSADLTCSSLLGWVGGDGDEIGRARPAGHPIVGAAAFSKAFFSCPRPR